MTIALIAVVAVMTSVSVSSPAIMAKKKHKSDDSSGFNRGAADAAKCNTDNCDKAYMNQPGKDWNNHSEKFNKNYAKGYCAGGGNEDDTLGGGVVGCD